MEPLLLVLVSLKESIFHRCVFIGLQFRICIECGNSDKNTYNGAKAIAPDWLLPIGNVVSHNGTDRGAKSEAQDTEGLKVLLSALVASCLFDDHGVDGRIENGDSQVKYDESRQNTLLAVDSS